MTKLSPWELLDLRLARQNKPPSNALEQKYYGNPADVVRFEQEKQRQQKQRQATHSKPKKRRPK